MINYNGSNQCQIIDLEASLLPLLDSIANLAVDPPSLYIDLKGTALGRHGSISILSLYIAPTKKTYLIDIRSLGKAVLSTTTKSGTSLKTILEPSTIPKVVFDIRNISDALFSLFQISVGGIKDLQLMELASRTGSRKFLSSLADCIEKDSPISAAAKAEWCLIKERGHKDVALLPSLYSVVNTKLRSPGLAFWRVTVREKTKDRIKLSQSPNYDGNSESNALGWSDETIDEERDSWNDDIIMEHLTGEYVLDENDEWVAAPRDDLEDYLDEEEEQEPKEDWYNDTARDCIGWEEDMIKNGEYF